EAQSRAMLHQTTVGIARSDLKSRLLFVNQKFCEMLGYAEAELLGVSFLNLTHPDDLKKNEELFRRLVQKANPFELEKRFIRKDGTSMWATVSVAPICDIVGKPQSGVAAVLDISSRKRAEEELLKALSALRDSEERLRLMIEGAREYALFVLER